MREAKEILDHHFLEMRWRCVSLAADLDRIARGENGGKVLRSDPRLSKLRKAVEVLLADSENRTEQVEMIFSDTSPPPSRTTGN